MKRLQRLVQVRLQSSLRRRFNVSVGKELRAGYFCSFFREHDSFYIKMRNNFFAGTFVFVNSTGINSSDTKFITCIQ